MSDLQPVSSQSEKDTQPPASKRSKYETSTLVRLLQTNSDIPDYPAFPSSGLHHKATELPQAGQRGPETDRMESSSIMNLAAVLYMEFGNFLNTPCYLVVLSDLGCLFLPKIKEKERNIFMNLQNNKIHAKFWRQDPTRKSHDHVLFSISDTLSKKLVVPKPGRGQDVFRLIGKEQSFFVNAGLLSQVLDLYHRTYQDKHLVTDVQVLRKMSAFSKRKFKDLETVKSLIRHHRGEAIKNGKAEISQLEQCVTVQSKAQVSCASCSRLFRSNCDYLLHSRTIQCKLGANLTETIKSFMRGLSPGPCDETPICGTCHKKFPNKVYLQLHKEIHIELGNIYPCYKCGRVFLSSYYYLQHRCFLYVIPKRTFHHNIPRVEANNIYGKIESSIVNTALTCPVCGKKVEYISRLFSHLHLGSNCLYSLLKRVSLDHEMSFDFQGLVQEVGKFSLSLVGCEACDETCVGQVAYMMHMDHHQLSAQLQCEGCRR